VRHEGGAAREVGKWTDCKKKEGGERDAYSKYMAYSRAHAAMSIVLYHHAGLLKSFESDERRRLQRAYDILDAADDELEPHYSELWRLVPGNDPPSDAARAKCHLSTLPHLQAALAKLLRIVPTYIALPMRIVPPTASAADATYESIRDEVDIRMADRRMPFVTSSERAEELCERTTVRVNAT